MTEIMLRYDAVQKSIISEAVYTEAVEQCANFNARLKQERRLRLPFLDSQTGVAQSHTDLWHSYRHRQPGKFLGQIYSYPEKRWKKKKHFFLFQERSMKAGDIETGEADMHQISTVENPAAAAPVEEMPELKNEVVSQKWYDEYDEYLEPPDAGEVCDDQSDISDFEDTYMKKKKKKGKGGSKGRKRKLEKDDKDKTEEEKEKPYGCEVKTPPKTRKEEEKVKTPPKPRKEEEKERGEDGKVQSSNYCDFCLGDTDENKKSGKAEELVSCSDCGRSGHPTCLQFTDNMTISVKKYPWQCIECKSCGLCGTSENDEQLLFCDDCDRGYHMYCLNPPLAEAPEGNWSCYLCIEEFHGGKKPAGMV